MISAVLLFMNIGTSEMMLIVFVALLLFGGKKLPELARGLGRGIREFKDASESIKRDISEQINNFEKDLEVKIDEPKQLEQHTASSAADTTAATDNYDYNPDLQNEYYGDNHYNPQDQENSLPKHEEETISEAAAVETKQAKPSDLPDEQLGGKQA